MTDPSVRPSSEPEAKRGPDARPQVFVRPNGRDLGDMPTDADLSTQAVMTLSPREIGVWYRLRLHLWRYGELPAGISPIAKIGGIGPRSFEKMIPALWPMFDHDEYGRWRDLDLEDVRNSRINVDSNERPTPVFHPPRQVDPKLSESRSRAGKGGAEARWSKRQRLQLIEGGRDDDDRAGSDAMANMANGMAKDVDLPADFASRLPSFGNVGASDARSQLASLDSSNLEEQEELASKQAGAPRASDATPSMANVASTAPGEPAQGVANAMASERDLPSQAEARLLDAAKPRPQPDDASMVDAIVRVCHGKVSKPEALGRLPVFRTAIAEGIDFFLDIVPKLESFARRNPHVENCANKHIIGDAREHARNRRAVEAIDPKSSTPDRTEKVYLYVDTPEFEAQEYYNRKKAKRDYSKPGETRKGWWFESQWPPGWKSDTPLSEQPRRPLP